MENNVFHCPYCGEEMKKEEYGTRDMGGNLLHFDFVRYSCNACGAASPVIEESDIAMQAFPGNEYDNEVARRLANEKLDRDMALTEERLFGK